MKKKQIILRAFTKASVITAIIDQTPVVNKIFRSQSFLIRQYLMQKNMRVDLILAVWIIEFFKTFNYSFSLIKWLAKDLLS